MSRCKLWDPGRNWRPRTKASMRSVTFLQRADHDEVKTPFPRISAAKSNQNIDTCFSELEPEPAQTRGALTFNCYPPDGRQPQTFIH